MACSLKQAVGILRGDEKDLCAGGRRRIGLKGRIRIGLKGEDKDWCARGGESGEGVVYNIHSIG